MVPGWASRNRSRAAEATSSTTRRSGSERAMRLPVRGMAEPVPARREPLTDDRGERVLERLVLRGPELALHPLFHPRHGPGRLAPLLLALRGERHALGPGVVRICCSFDQAHALEVVDDLHHGLLRDTGPLREIGQADTLPV